MVMLFALVANLRPTMDSRSRCDRVRAAPLRRHAQHDRKLRDFDRLPSDFLSAPHAFALIDHRFIFSTYRQ
jgi:hypothetical protein